MTPLLPQGRALDPIRRRGGRSSRSRRGSRGGVVRKVGRVRIDVRTIRVIRLLEGLWFVLQEEFHIPRFRLVVLVGLLRFFMVMKLTCLSLISVTISFSISSTFFLSSNWNVTEMEKKNEKAKM